MAMRKAQDDAMARTQAERDLGDLFASNGHSVGSYDEDVTAARGLLSNFPAVEFERGTGRTPDGQKVAQRRVVITGPWVVDPDAVLGGQAGDGKSAPPTS
jgi:hypothetical protein